MNAIIRWALPRFIVYLATALGAAILFFIIAAIFAFWPEAVGCSFPEALTARCFR